MTHPDQDIIDFLTKDLDLRAAPDWMIERARAFRDGGWLPIKEAPKDGTPVDLWGSRNGEARRFANAYWGEIHVGTEPMDSFRWMHCCRDDYGSFKYTHFRPLPNPPKDTEQ